MNIEIDIHALNEIVTRYYDQVTKLAERYGTILGFSVLMSDDDLPVLTGQWKKRVLGEEMGWSIDVYSKIHDDFKGRVEKVEDVNDLLGMYTIYAQGKGSPTHLMEQLNALQSHKYMTAEETTPDVKAQSEKLAHDLLGAMISIHAIMRNDIYNANVAGMKKALGREPVHSQSMRAVIDIVHNDMREILRVMTLNDPKIEPISRFRLKNFIS